MNPRMKKIERLLAVRQQKEKSAKHALAMAAADDDQARLIVSLQQKNLSDIKDHGRGAVHYAIQHASGPGEAAAKFANIIGTIHSYANRERSIGKALVRAEEKREAIYRVFKTEQAKYVQSLNRCHALESYADGVRAVEFAAQEAKDEDELELEAYIDRGT